MAVARLAGVPDQVVQRAKQVLKQLEKNRTETGGLAAGLGELPLFATLQDTEEEPSDTILDRLADIELDALSPRDALDLLYELSAEARATKR